MHTKIVRHSCKALIENFVFSSKWMLLCFCFGLIAVFGVYALTFVLDIWQMIVDVIHNAQEGHRIHAEDMVYIVLQVIDVALVGTLLRTVIGGTYHCFIDKEHEAKNEDISSSALKTKVANTIVGVSSIHLAQVLIHADSWEEKVLIHMSFVVGVLVLGAVEYLHTLSESLESKTEIDEEEHKHEYKEG